jgi:hypothetical protein
MTDLAARPEVTGRRTSAPNLLLNGYADDDVLTRDQLADEWRCTVRSIRNYQYEPDGLPFFLHAGKVSHRAGSARAWMRAREQRRNQRRAPRERRSA